MKSNEQLQKDVMDALKWEPQLNATEIGVIVHDGIVSLTGTVDNYNKKIAAEAAVKDVSGVKAVVEKIEVRYPTALTKTDDQIAADVLKSLENHWNVPDERIKVKVEHAWVTLTGDVSWNYQRDAAKRAIENIPGVKGVSNNILIRSQYVNALEKSIIEKALRRHWSINADDIHVAVNENRVTLTGKVNSLFQKEEAEKIAWKTPGVVFVENDIVIDYKYDYVI
ncbi:BON domain-containing protein [Flavobacterium terrigena]|uniref:Osmotically-inducible protein OsmY, contains BON domain n=1 Tax=Flavobacterium terrigena TaxID=402734 RepID=A0A1H6QLJ4_9FLAO|nr:BON domain-containing protein [Flavobacterium terrigena]SEI40330.1 Osmotically-inducible protein OsmY, contains BON domain [Flavobacterium terrigena]